MTNSKSTIFLLLALLLSVGALAKDSNASRSNPLEKKLATEWLKSMGMNAEHLSARPARLIATLSPIQIDWLAQDFSASPRSLFDPDKSDDLFASLIERDLAQMKEKPSPLGRDYQSFRQNSTNAFEDWLALYLRVCAQRRRERLAKVLKESPRIVFLINRETGNAPRLSMSISDGPYNGNPFIPGASVKLLELAKDAAPTVRTLLNDPKGMIRDLDVSYDGQRILFSWKKSREDDDYHIYEMEIESGALRQITKDKGVADIQARYLHDRILFHSSRCVTVVDCNESIDVLNFYSSDLQGGDIRRLTYDQVSTQFPSVLPDGRVIYTRWEYNDRGQIFPQGLFTMNGDGSHQEAIYGNNSWYPTSLIQARGIPGSKKVLTVLAGHHTPPCGNLALLDISRGREEGKGIELVSPKRKANYKHVDKADQDEALFQYPFPLSEEEYLTGYSLFGRKKSMNFGIYWMASDGRRELLAWNANGACRHPLPAASRAMPPLRSSVADPSAKTGVYFVGDIYKGEGLKDIPRGTIKRLRVIALGFRPAAIGTSYNEGQGGTARVNTPVSISGAWDTKTILGDAQVYEDGSVFFRVPARTPVYFQALDKEGRAVQSMRSWSTLRPGETFSCVGCHEHKNTAPLATGGTTLAMRAGPQELAPFYGPARGFSFAREIQPILDHNCVKCHKGEPYRWPVKPDKKGVRPPGYCFFPDQKIKERKRIAIFTLPEPTTLGGAVFKWYVSPGKKGSAKAPVRWELFYADGETWKKIKLANEDFEPGASENRMRFNPLRATALKVEVELADKMSGGIDSWILLDAEGKKIPTGEKDKPFSLSGRLVHEPLSGRAWSESYLAFTRAFMKRSPAGFSLFAKSNDLIDWISPQGGPAMLAPYSFGAAKSPLLAMLRKGHNKVNLTLEEMEKIAAWIDLAVPYCGDYQEAAIWTPEERRWYARQVEKQKRLANGEATRSEN